MIVSNMGFVHTIKKRHKKFECSFSQTRTARVQLIFAVRMLLFVMSKSALDVGGYAQGLICPIRRLARLRTARVQWISALRMSPSMLPISAVMLGLTHGDFFAHFSKIMRRHLCIYLISCVLFHNGPPFGKNRCFT